MTLACSLVGGVVPQGCRTERPKHTVQSPAFPQPPDQDASLAESPKNLPNFFQHQLSQVCNNVLRIHQRVGAACLYFVTKSNVFSGYRSRLLTRKHAVLWRLARRALNRRGCKACAAHGAHSAGVVAALQRGGAHVGQEAAQCHGQKRWGLLFD